jgi:mRNA interferase RelE/StbE
LPSQIAARIYRKFQRARGDPLHFFEKLVGRDDYRMRVGDYRIIAEIDLEQRVIFVTEVGHRKNIYEK